MTEALEKYPEERTVMELMTGIHVEHLSNNSILNLAMLCEGNEELFCELVNRMESRTMDV